MGKGHWAGTSKMACGELRWDAQFWGILFTILINQFVFIYSSVCCLLWHQKKGHRGLFSCPFSFGNGRSFFFSTQRTLRPYGKLYITDNDVVISVVWISCSLLWHEWGMPSLEMTRLLKNPHWVIMEWSDVTNHNWIIFPITACPNGLDIQSYLT